MDYDQIASNINKRLRRTILKRSTMFPAFTRSATMTIATMARRIIPVKAHTTATVTTAIRSYSNKCCNKESRITMTTKSLEIAILDSSVTTTDCDVVGHGTSVASLLKNKIR